MNKENTWEQERRKKMKDFLSDYDEVKEEIVNPALEKKKESWISTKSLEIISFNHIQWVNFYWLNRKQKPTFNDVLKEMDKNNLTKTLKEVFDNDSKNAPVVLSNVQMSYVLGNNVFKYVKYEDEGIEEDTYVIDVWDKNYSATFEDKKDELFGFNSLAIPMRSSYIKLPTKKIKDPFAQSVSILSKDEPIPDLIDTVELAHLNNMYDHRPDKIYKKVSDFKENSYTYDFMNKNEGTITLKDYWRYGIKNNSERRKEGNFLDFFELHEFESWDPDDWDNDLVGILTLYPVKDKWAYYYLDKNNTEDIYKKVYIFDYPKLLKNSHISSEFKDPKYEDKPSKYPFKEHLEDQIKKVAVAEQAMAYYHFYNQGQKELNLTSDSLMSQGIFDYSKKYLNYTPEKLINDAFERFKKDKNRLTIEDAKKEIQDDFKKLHHSKNDMPLVFENYYDQFALKDNENFQLSNPTWEQEAKLTMGK